MEHIVLLFGRPGLLAQEAVGGCKAVVRLADQLAVPQALPCIQSRLRKLWGAAKLLCVWRISSLSPRLSPAHSQGGSAWESPSWAECADPKAQHDVVMIDWASPENVREATCRLSPSLRQLTFEIWRQVCSEVSKGGQLRA